MHSTSPTPKIQGTLQKRRQKDDKTQVTRTSSKRVWLLYMTEKLKQEISKIRLFKKDLSNDYLKIYRQ